MIPAKRKKIQQQEDVLRRKRKEYSNKKLFCVAIETKYNHKNVFPAANETKFSRKKVFRAANEKTQPYAGLIVPQNKHKKTSYL